MIPIPDHPIIAAMERFGSPKMQRVAHQCSVCEEPIFEGETCWLIPDYGWAHETCIERHIAEVD